MMKVFYILLLIGVAAASSGQGIDEENNVSYGYIDNFFNGVLEKYLPRTKAVFDRINKALQEKTGDLLVILGDEVDVLERILRPKIIHISNIMNSMGGDAQHLMRYLKSFFGRMIEDVRGLAEENKQILISMLDHMLDKIIKIITPKEERTIVEAFSVENYSLIRKILDRFLTPIVNLIKSVLNRIAEALDENLPQVKEIIDREINEITRILKPRIVRIMELLNNLGANVQKISNDIKEALNNMISDMKGISSENKKILQGIVRRILEILLNTVPKVEDKVPQF